MTESRETVLKMCFAGVVGAVIALGSVHWLSQAEAQVPAAQLRGQDQMIPAIEIREGSIALVQGPGNQYFVVDRQGIGYPVRYRIQDEQVPVGSRLLQSP